MYIGAATNENGLARELSSARAQLASQERQIQELNHRVANSLQLAADMLVFEQLRSRDPVAQAALEASRARLVAVGELHRYLYEHAGKPSVELRPFLTGLCEAIAATTGLRVAITADGTSIPGAWPSSSPSRSTRSPSTPPSTPTTAGRAAASTSRPAARGTNWS
ncbi:MAG: hypothetical protein DI570_01345 [Phenylobacterium zucineum]|nr:MAG: hypothetical protein DI570_01345 [Phenylobacterium zucineum]